MRRLVSFIRFIWIIHDFSFKEIVYGYVIWLVCLIPMFVLTLVVEVSVDIDILTFSTPDQSLSGTTGSVLVYLAIYVIHSIVCVTFFINGILGDYSNTTKTKQRIIKKHTIIILLVTSVALILVSYSSLNISNLSHSVVYTYFINIEELTNLFTVYSLAWGVWKFYIFSIIPISAIVFAMSAVGVAIFDMSRYVCKFEEINNYNDLDREIKSVLNHSRQVFIKMIIVLTTSSVATSLYFLLPYEGKMISPYEYYSFAKAMSIKWGSLYSITLLFLYVFPYMRYSSKVQFLRRTLMLQPGGMLDNFNEATSSYKLLSDNSGYVLGILLPLIVSIVSPMIS